MKLSTYNPRLEPQNTTKAFLAMILIYIFIIRVQNQFSQNYLTVHLAESEGEHVEAHVS